MKAQIKYNNSPWQMPISVSKCLCPDGKRRFVKLTNFPDTYFSIPAKVKHKGKTVTGFVSSNGEDDFKFTPYSFGKNAYLFEKENK